MDKFGIFKLLNSFAENFGKNKTSDSEPTKTVTTNPPPKDATIPPERVFAPLQSKMVSTMNVHDEFVKRVMEKNARANSHGG